MNGPSFKYGRGCYLVCSLGKSYFDFTNPLNLLGYAQEDINEALKKSMAGGLGSPLARFERFELETKLKTIFPYCERALFYKSAAEVPVFGAPQVYDESDTSFRYPRFCESNYKNLEPDILILGGPIANGLPLTVVLGKTKYLRSLDNQEDGSLTLAIVAMSKVIDLLRSKYSLDKLWQEGEKWLNTFNSFWPEAIRIQGIATRGRFGGDPLIRALFFQEALASGMIFNQEWYFNFPLAEKSKITLGAVKDIIWKIKSRSPNAGK